MIKHFCDNCEKHIVFFEEDPRRLLGKIGDLNCSLDIVVYQSYGDDAELCEPCFNGLLENAFAEHQESVVRLRADKAKGYSVPDA